MREAGDGARPQGTPGPGTAAALGCPPHLGAACTRARSAPQNLSPGKIFHVIVAPCYDKKLEALREDVPTAPQSSRGADCVLTSGEAGGLGAATPRPSGPQACEWGRGLGSLRKSGPALREVCSA